ncbi:head maturation protease, ClpP-related [uncultured Parolsenella sp.]|uniref:head maturation protease, ClpP-related n=1 Tax=uncultured Parolsenella sp. TaxID=2083008 RepID=UPI0027D9BBC5|nr:head maturation protease, ClpP-related [uncultured Parolsenella sp.]
MHDILVYGPIGESFFESGGMSARQFVRELGEARGDDVTVHVNSCGGDAMDAQAMAEAIRAYGGRVTASIEGIAASAASYFALTADEVVMNPSALVMVHNPSSTVSGEAGDMRRAADTLDKVRDAIVLQYVRKTGRDGVEVAAWMDAETWFDAEEALAAGLVDALTEEPPVAALLDSRHASAWRNAPAALTKRPGEAPAGEGGRTMAGDETPGVADAGAAAAGAGAVPKAVCVAGTFLNA